MSNKETAVRALEDRVWAGLRDKRANLKALAETLEHGQPLLPETQEYDLCHMCVEVVLGRVYMLAAEADKEPQP